MSDMKEYYLLFVFSILFFSCQDQKMIRPLKPYAGNKIRTNGYYYRHLEKDNYFQVYFFSKNGTFLREQFTTFSKKDWETPEKIILARDWAKIASLAINVGAFWEEPDGSLEFQCWSPGGLSNVLVLIKAETIGDTSFVTKDSWLVYDEDEHFPLRDTYYFHPMSFRPDSLYFSRQKALGAKHVP